MALYLRWLERAAHNCVVVGSSPTGATTCESRTRDRSVRRSEDSRQSEASERYKPTPIPHTKRVQGEGLN